MSCWLTMTIKLYLQLPLVPKPKDCNAMDFSASILTQEKKLSLNYIRVEVKKCSSGLVNWNPELTTLGSTRMYILRTLTDASAHSNTVFLLSSTFEFSSRMVNQQNQSLDTINNVELKSSFPDTHCSTIFSFRPSENYFSFIFDKSRLRALPFCGLLHSLANNSSSSF